MDPRDEVVDATSPAPLTLGNRWAMRPEMFAKLAAVHRAPHYLSRAAEASSPKPQAARRAAQRAGGAVAVIPLTGIITPRGSFFSMLFGGGSGGLMDFRESFAEAVASPDVGAIVLDVDSPGGLIDLVPEAAAEVRAARGSKPIVAVANTMAASAAYWIAAQADELVVTPSGDVGSVGVYVLHEDWSGWNEQRGIVPSYVFAGRYKVEGNPDEPLSDETRAAWQSEVDELYAMFVEAVAEGRGISAEAVRAGYGEGRTLMASRALEAGMVDRVDTLEGVVAGLLSAGGGAGAVARVPNALLDQRAAAAAAAAANPASAAEVDPPAPPVEADPPAADEDPASVPDAEARAALAAVLL